jgi:hypothetical protein
MKVSGKHTLWISAGIAMMLSGCATPKQVMPTDVYDKFAQLYGHVERCGMDGQLTPDSALWAKRMLGFRLASYSYDSTYLNNRYQALMPSITTPPPETCNRIAMLSEEYKQNTQASNAQVEANSRALEEQTMGNRPVNTYCNSIGSQTNCTSH